MKYTRIKSDTQYNQYCETHEQLTLENYSVNQDEIELIEILIDEYENRTIEFSCEMDPVEILAFLLSENDITKSQIARELDVSRQLITDILNYRRNISKTMIFKLSERFKIVPIAFAKPYPLLGLKSTQMSESI